MIKGSKCGLQVRILWDANRINELKSIWGWLFSFLDTFKATFIRFLVLLKGERIALVVSQLNCPLSDAVR